jgi:hypothetical protein
MSTRREFLKSTGLATAVLISGAASGSNAGRTTPSATVAVPWFRRTLRWGQTNITEIDPQRYDIAWWRAYWKRTHTQGVIINAGGIVAYYPTAVPLHRQAQYLGGRDLFGELCHAAHEDGLVVLARMDSNRAHEEFYRAHPDWFAVDAAGKPYQAGDLYVSCINGPYYQEHIPAILREIVDRYHPEGFTDNSWSGLGRNAPCFCENCQKSFRDQTGEAIPKEKRWNDPAYRKWIQWSYERRLAIWDLNNRVAKAAGGPDCIWVGMNSGSISGQCQSFRDYRAICRRAEMILLDHQSRSDGSGFQQNADTGNLIHGLLGWDKLIPESMALYQAGKPTFRLASKPEPEARLWMLEGFAGGIQPWWHHVGAYHEDRRMYETVEPLYRWHQDNERYLVEREPVATVGLVWSQANFDFYARNEPESLAELPWRGMVQALVRARIPYVPVHADDIGRDATRLSALILPNLAAMSDTQVATVRQFVEKGGSLLATGQTSRFDEWGDPRPDFGLGDLFAAHARQAGGPENEVAARKSAVETVHTYLRLSPELRAGMDGPHIATEPAIHGERHAVLKGFERTDILPFGGVLEPLRLDGAAQVLLTFVPSFPIYPPETAWMRQPKTDIPGLILNTTPLGSRIAFLPADLDRRFGRDNLPDHGDLLANLVRWIARESLPLVVEGPGLVDCRLYRQRQRMILHVVNLTNAGTWRQPVHELISIGPLRVRIKLPPDLRGSRVRLLVSGRKVPVSASRGWCRFQLASLLDQEVVVLT